MIKEKEFNTVRLRIDPMLQKVSAYIPETVRPDKAIVEKDVTSNFLVIMVSWLLIKSKNQIEKVILLDGDEPQWEITIKKLK